MKLKEKKEKCCYITNIHRDSKCLCATSR